jgi:hypothetical protein
MARYSYLDTIKRGDFPDISDADWAILAAAFTVAKAAHEGQSRGKIDPSVGYISHPIMVAQILWRLGERDPATLAAALLHDAIEENREYREDPGRLREALIRALEEHGLNKGWDTYREPPSPATSIGDRIYSLCKEVTNPEVYGGDGIKEGDQIDHVPLMSFPAKKIKMCDQAASLVCNLTMANNPAEFSPEQETRFADKADAYATRIFQSVQDNPKERDILKPYASFFGKARNNVGWLLGTDDAAQKQALRERFDFDRILEPEPYVNILPVMTEAVEKLSLANPDPNVNPEKRVGVTGVEFDARGNVVRYALWTEWNMPRSEASDIQKKMTNEIRIMRRKGTGGRLDPGSDPVRALLLPGPARQVTERSADGKQQRLAGIERVFDLSPPLNGRAFATAALAVKAIELPGYHLIQQTSNRLMHKFEAEHAPKPSKPPAFWKGIG